MLNPRMGAQRREGLADGLGQGDVLGQHIVFFEQLQRGQRGAAGQRIAGVRVRMQKAAGDIVVVKGLVDRVGG